MLIQKCCLAAVLYCLALACPASLTAATVFRWQTDEKAGTTDLWLGEQPVVRYMHAYDSSTPERLHETYKVYHHVFGPGSKTVITKGAGGKYTHHRGLFIGWNMTGFEGRSLDFWHCRNGAHLRHEKFIEKSADAEHGTMTAEIHWNDAAGTPVIVEHRTVTVRTEKTTGGWQIDWSTKLVSRRGEITLNGDRQHAGFQFRAAQSVAAGNSGRYQRPAEMDQRPEAIQVGDRGNPPPHINLGWFALNYELDGTRYTIEYFDNPALPRPALFSERPYGRFGTFFKTKLNEDQPLEMKYRVIVRAGTSSVDEIQTRCEAFLKSLK
ncbi:MAG: DUF6807 family protein [Planctomycetaceae bacterium]